MFAAPASAVGACPAGCARLLHERSIDGGGAFKEIAIGLPSDPALYGYLHDGSAIGREINARYFVLTSLVVLIVASIAATATALWLFSRNLESIRKGQARNSGALRWFSAAIVLALVAGCAWIWLKHPPVFHRYVGKDVFPTLIPLYFNGDPGFAFSQAFILETLPRITSTLTVLPAICIVACGASLLIHHRRAAGDIGLSYEEVKSYALERLAHVKILLAVSSALFVAAVLYSKAYLAWPLSVLSKQIAEQTQYALAVEGFVTYEGVRFALVLFALLSSMYLAVRWSVARLADKDKATLLAEPGLTFNLPQIMQSIVTVSAPLLVGPVADALKSIAQN